MSRYPEYHFLKKYIFTTGYNQTPFFSLMSLYFCACFLRLYCLETKEDRQQRLEFIEKQLDLLTMDCKAKIKRITEEVERQVRST